MTKVGQRHHGVYTTWANLFHDDNARTKIGNSDFDTGVSSGLDTRLRHGSATYATVVDFAAITVINPIRAECEKVE